MCSLSLCCSFVLFEDFSVLNSVSKGEYVLFPCKYRYFHDTMDTDFAKTYSFLVLFLLYECWRIYWEPMRHLGSDVLPPMDRKDYNMGCITWRICGDAAHMRVVTCSARVSPPALSEHPYPEANCRASGSI